MATRTPHSGREKAGHGDSPRQDTQRPTHVDHGDAGGQESTASRFPRTQRPADVPPPSDAPPPPGTRHADPPLPQGGRQAQRPGQHGRAEDGLGARDVESFRSAQPHLFGDAGEERRADAIHGGNAGSRRSSRSSTSSRRDRAVGSEEPPPRPRRRS